MKRFVCRCFQFVMKYAIYCLPWRELTVLRGKDAIIKLPDLIQAQGVCHVLIVTGPHISKSGLMDKLLDMLRADEIVYEIFDRTVANPTIDTVEEAVALYREHGCDGIIALGGGSPMDCAKACGARIARPNRTLAQMKGMLRVARALPPLYAIPTTAGTGSETTLAAVVTDAQTHHKYAINDTALIPRAAVLDPMLTLSLPPQITAATGMDALCHAVEAYIGRCNTRETRRNALRAVQLVFENLALCVREGGNYEARANMLEASFRAGLAFTRAFVGYVHALAHPLGGQYQLAHGLANAVLMPYVFRYYGKAAWKPLAELSDAVHLCPGGAPIHQKADAFIAAIERMNASLGLPNAFPDIREEDIPQMATFAAQEGNWFYPAPKVLLQPELETLYRQVKQGHS